MIVLDTHVWVWWVHGDTQLPTTYHAYIQANESQGLGISIISCWEVAKLVEYGRLTLPLPVIELLDLTPRITVESTQLPDSFHRDPADQMIVATSRVYSYPLVTLDKRIRAYPHVQIAP